MRQRTGVPPSSTPGTEISAAEPPATDAEGDAEATTCARALRASLSPELGVVLDELGYDSVLADACELDRAVRENDQEACEAFSIRALRSGCLARLAVTHGQPDLCPALLDRGRDPVCLAWAARAPARCAAAVGGESQRCRAPFEDNQALCRELGLQRARCEREAAWASALIRPINERALPPTRSSLHATYVPDERRGVPPPAGANERHALTFSHQRGVYLRREGCQSTLVLVPEANGLTRSRELELTQLSIGLDELPPLGAASDSWRDVTLADPGRVRLSLRPPVGGLPAATTNAVARVRGDVRLLRLQPRRGGILALEGDLILPTEEGRYRVHVELHTYLRDVDPESPECARATDGP